MGFCFCCFKILIWVQVFHMVIYDPSNDQEPCPINDYYQECPYSLCKNLFVLGGQWCFAIAGLSSYFHCYCRTILEYSCHSWAVYHRFPKPLLFRGRAVCNYPPSCWSHTANLCCGIIRPNLGLLAWDLFLCWQYTGWTSAGNCWAKWPSDPGLV